MNQTQRILLFFLLPMLAPLLLPPDWYGPSGWIAIALVVILFGVLGFFLVQGRSLALTLLIFLQGFNVIIRLMMFWPNFTFNDGSVDFLFVVTSLISMAISAYLVLRLDKVDVRVQMVR